MKSIMMLYGGRSEEHDVSLRSASFILKSLQEASFKVIPVGIDHKGNWYVQQIKDEVPEILPLLERNENRVRLEPANGIYNAQGEKLDVDLVFPVLHGTFGEDGCLQGLIEMMELPYVGANTRSSAIAMDKITAKILWEKQNLPVVPYHFIEKWQWDSTDFNQEEYMLRWVEDLGLPLFIKPSNAGSSVGVSKVDTPQELKTALEEAFRHDTRVLIEKAVNAREIELSVLGNHQVETFLPGEIAPNHSFYDYDAKYIDPDGAALLIPARLPEELRRKAMKIALEAYRCLSLEGLSRVDLFLDRDDESFYINEVNTLPGFTSISMFPQLCKAGGLEPADLMKRLVKLALERFKEKSQLNF